MYLRVLPGSLSTQPVFVLLPNHPWVEEDDRSIEKVVLLVALKAEEAAATCPRNS